ncbi:MAG: M48 family metallopeptidase [Candidatus Binatia bacterium]
MVAPTTETRKIQTSPSDNYPGSSSDCHGRMEGKNRHGGTAIVALLLISAALSACVAVGPAPGGRRAPREDYPPPAPSTSSRRADSYEVERLRRVMVPLFRGMNQPCRVDQSRVGIINQNEINAANAGNCEFYVTVGLLRRASDDQLRGILAHELSHQDLGHVARAQVLGAGIGILSAGLQQLFPGAGALAPIAGELVVRGHSRNEEFAADRHAVGILQRTGHSKDDLLNALTWIRQSSGGSGGGGFLSTHPALDERISTIQRLR